MYTNKGFTRIVNFDEDRIDIRPYFSASSKSTPGFTLIELLVVIAIIGILSAIVLASLNSARNRSKVASLKAEVHEIKNQAEIFYATHHSYIDQNGDTVCDAMTEFRDKVFDLMASQPYPFGMCLVTLSGDAYAAEVALGDNEYWCTDSNDYTGESQPENPTPSGSFSGYSWSNSRICDGSSSCGGHIRTICNQI